MSFKKSILNQLSTWIGKTTTAHLVCKELGMDMVEFNASDTRSKRSLQEEIKELLSCKSLSSYVQGKYSVYIILLITCCFITGKNKILCAQYLGWVFAKLPKLFIHFYIMSLITSYIQSWFFFFFLRIWNILLVHWKMSFNVTLLLSTFSGLSTLFTYVINCRKFRELMGGYVSDSVNNSEFTASCPYQPLHPKLIFV